MANPVIRGSSGATLVYGVDDVTKYDVERTGRRVRDQGVWLRTHQVTCLPDVREIYHDGYRMELLRSFDLEDLVTDRRGTCEIILDTLPTLWKNYKFGMTPPYDGLQHYDWLEHRRYVVGLLRDVTLSDYRRTLRRFCRRINWMALRRGLTHGDPIFENLLYRKVTPYKHEWVLIDPIPACPALPDVEASDVGRVIQSAVGYERIRYGLWDATDPWDRELMSTPIAFVVNRWDRNFDLNEVRAAIYFAIIHTLRGVRTTPVATTSQTVLRQLVAQLIEEAERWMR